MKTHFRQLGQYRFHIRTWGDPANPPLLMLHGFPEHSGAWDELATALSPHFYCIAPDQRGYGQSDAPPEVDAYKARHLVADMVTLLKDMETGPATVLGHDWGSAIAYGLAIGAPEMVSRLIVLNGVHPGPYQKACAAGGAQTDAAQYFHALKREGSEDHFAKDNFSRLLALFSADMDLSWLTPEKEAEYKAEWARPGRLRGMINWYRASPIQIGGPGETLNDVPNPPIERLTVPMPHLLIWGMNDTALLPESTKDLEAYCPQLTRIEMPDADHWLAHQKSDEVAQAILDWIN